MTKGSTGRFAMALALVSTLVGGAFAGTALAQEQGADEETVRFTFGSTGEPSSLNPMSGYIALDFYFWTASYHLLVDFDENLGAEPAGGPDAGLATDIQVSDDGMEFTYTIRDDVVWSDGTPLTAEDVAFTLNLYKNNNAYLPQNYLTLIDGDVELVDETTVRWRTKEPTGLYSGEFPYMYDYILPKHVFEGIEKPKQYENVPQTASGPFMITEFEVGQFVRMERNPEWTGPEPAIDEIVHRTFRNEDALAEALRQGEIDFAYFLAPNIFNTISAEEGIASMVGSIPSFSEIGMNTGSAFQEPSGAFTPHGDGHPALTDPVVRRAIRMAIDSEQLNESVMLGYGIPGSTIIPPVSVQGARWEPTGDELIAWDIEGANALLEEAGYVDSDGDGVREMPEGSLEPGRPLEFRYYPNNNEQTAVDAAPFVSEWLEQIGIRTNVEAIASGRLGDIINAGEYDLFSWGWIPDPDPDSALSWFTCDQRPPDGKTYGNNDSYYCNPEYDALFDQQRTASDPAERWEIVQEMQRIYYEDSAYAIMWYDPVFSAWRGDRWEGFVPQPQPDGDPLESWGGPSEVWWTLRPASGSGGEGGGGTSGSDTRGISAGVWIGVAAALVLVIGGWIMIRRRRPDEDEA
ncbi:MAG: ABC transporter substrate-binding protein [Actinomycetota bacterium]